MTNTNKNPDIPGIRDVDFDTDRDANVLPFPQKIKASEPKREANSDFAFDATNQQEVSEQAWEFAMDVQWADSYENFKHNLALKAQGRADVLEYLGTVGMAKEEEELKSYFAAWQKKNECGKAAPLSLAWPDPEPLPEGLSPVEAFNSAFLPASIGPWVLDIADRMQCPLDFVGIPVMTALGAVLGRRIGIRPQRYDTWTEVPNLWGCIVGRPGVLKTPAIAEALKPLMHLESVARDVNGGDKLCQIAGRKCTDLVKRKGAMKPR
jgi:hypothetical protein